MGSININNEIIGVRVLLKREKLSPDLGLWALYRYGSNGSVSNVCYGIAINGLCAGLV